MSRWGQDTSEPFSESYLTPALWEVYIFYEWNLVGWRGFEPPSSRPEDERSTDWATTRKKRRNEEALLYVLTQIMSK